MASQRGSSSDEEPHSLSLGSHCSNMLAHSQRKIRWNPAAWTSQPDQTYGIQILVKSAWCLQCHNPSYIALQHAQYFLDIGQAGDSPDNR